VGGREIDDAAAQFQLVTAISTPPFDAGRRPRPTSADLSPENVGRIAAGPTAKRKVPVADLPQIMSEVSRFLISRLFPAPGPSWMSAAVGDALVDL
jgi:hypothetical protein